MNKESDKEKECNINELKENYSRLQKKLGLPEFDDMNADFQVEKISEADSDFLIREVRKFMSEKFSSYLRFIETLLHPVNSPMFVFSIAKTLTTKDKQVLQEIYKRLAKIEVKILELEIEYNEEKETSFINDSFKEWQEIKKDLLTVVKEIDKNWDNNKPVDNGKGYFG